MSTLPIVFYRDPRIRNKSQLLSQSLDTKGSIFRMRKAMNSHDGIGIAAPQIGELVRVFLVSKELFPDLTLPSDVFINPKILRKGFKLSAHGLLARVVQHELDHLDGILFIDRAAPESLHEVMYDKEGKEIFRPWKP